jgi:hypothetical protein
MRKVQVVIALVTMVFVPTLPTAAAPKNGSATKSARASALAECQREAKARMFGNRTIQRRNFLKDCMIDRMFYGGIN